MNGINRLLKSTLNVNDEIVKAVESYLIKFKLPINRELLSLGEIADKIYFIESGLIREYYYLPDKHEDTTTQNVSENTFFYSTIAYLSVNPSERIVETLEPTKGYSIRKSDLDELIDRYPVLAITLCYYE